MKTYWYYVVRKERKPAIEAHNVSMAADYFNEPDDIYYPIKELSLKDTHLMFGSLNRLRHKNEPVLVTPFQVEHNGKVIFTLTNPEHITIVMANILKADQSPDTDPVMEIDEMLYAMNNRHSLTDIVKPFIK